MKKYYKANLNVTQQRTTSGIPLNFQNFPAVH